MKLMCSMEKKVKNASLKHLSDTNANVKSGSSVQNSYIHFFAIPKLPKPSLVRLYYQSYAAPPPTAATAGSLQSKGSQAKPEASKPARDFTFGIQAQNL